MSDEILRESTLQRFREHERWWDTSFTALQTALTPDQQDRLSKEEAELSRLWDASVDQLLAALLPPDEVRRLHEELGGEAAMLPEMFAIEPDRPVQLAIYRKIEPLRGPLYDLICEKLDYCARRDWFAGALGGALAMLAFLISHGLVVDFSLSSMIVSGIRSGYFDRLCECQASQNG